MNPTSRILPSTCSETTLGIVEKRRDRKWTYPAKYRVGPDYYPTIVSVTGEQFTRSQENNWKQWREYKSYLESVGRGKGSNDPYYSLLLNMDYGGAFFTIDHEYTQSDPWFATEGFVRNYIYDHRFEGTPVPYSLSVGKSDWAWLQESDFTTALQAGMGYGSTAISRCQPTNPVANASQFLGELSRDGLPHAGSDLLKNRLRSFKDLGGDYLNVEFGWKPFVSDIKKFLHSIKNSHEILKQYERDSGKLIRRSYRFPKITVDSGSGLWNSSPAQPAMTPQFWDTQWAPINYSWNYTQEWWFKGAFTYYLTRGDSSFSKMERWAEEADKLLGIKLTPDVLWDLTPWSWFADWIGNFGDVLSNVTAFSGDGLTMRYGYVMGKFVFDKHLQQDGIRFADHIPRKPIWQNFTTTVKSRQKATPYGFGLNPSVDFTTRQWAILGALGMTQGPGLLKSM